MEWKTPYAIYRLDAEGKVQLVSEPINLAKAKYWLQYIAEPYDVLCKTPVHPKHSKKTPTPEYWAHKEKGGPAYVEADWRKQWQGRGWKNEPLPEPTGDSSEAIS